MEDTTGPLKETGDRLKLAVRSPEAVGVAG